MDTFTHAISAMLVARATRPKTLREGQLSLNVRSWAGFAAGAFPDSDFIVMLFGIPAYLEYHRGATHSLILMPLWSGLLAWLFSLLSRRRYHWRAFYEVCLLGILVHIFGDVITDYGTRIFSPFSDYRMALSTTFIIDWYFTGIIMLGLGFSYFSKQYKQQFALAGFCLLLCYVLAQSWWRHLAKQEIYRSLPPGSFQNALVHVLPQPVSPFNWKLVVASPDHYLVSYVNLFRHRQKTAPANASIFARADALYMPPNKLQWEYIPRFGPPDVQALAHRIWGAPQMTVIRQFMELPAVQRIETTAKFRCVWFADERFVLRDLRAPFMFGGCESKDGHELRLMQFRDGNPLPLE